jgi:hypothetical protein
MRNNHKRFSPAFKAKVALGVLRGEKTTAELVSQMPSLLARGGFPLGQLTGKARH